MELAYIIEINLCTIIIMVILNMTTNRSFSAMSNTKMFFRSMLVVNLIFAVSDIVIYSLDGVPGVFTRLLLQVGNIIHIEAVCILGYFWTLFVFSFIGKPLNKKKTFIWAIPMGIAVLLIVLNPIIPFTFSLDEGNAYHRESGIFLQWAITWFYILTGTVLSVIAMLKSPNKVKRRSYYPLIAFILFPAIGSIVQMLFYGVSTSQIGIGVGLLIIYSIQANFEISTDNLTGLNNRGGMENYVSGLLDNTKSYNLTVFMLDLNDFKSINDKLGHTVGDSALRDAANALKIACASIDERLFICRFGGDEFVLIGKNIKENSAESIISSIKTSVNNINVSNDGSYTIDFSFGYCAGNCTHYDDFTKLLKKADEVMYVNKKEIKAQRV